MYARMGVGGKRHGARPRVPPPGVALSVTDACAIETASTPLPVTPRAASESQPPAVAETITGDYGCVRLVNYLRSRVAEGAVPVATAAECAVLRDEVVGGANGVWTEERHLLPVLPGDALLFALSFGDDDDDGGGDAVGGPVGGGAGAAAGAL